jgi:5-hydroxyisourate hydrolase
MSKRRDFLAAGGLLSVGGLLAGCAASKPVTLAQAAPAAPAAPGSKPPGRLTFHGIDTYHGATVGTLRVDVSMLEGGQWRRIKSFDTAKNGRSDGALFEGPTFKPGRYELAMHVADYYAALGTRLPNPAFFSTVPLRFGIADASERYHIAVLFGPWSYSYYRGS